MSRIGLCAATRSARWWPQGAAFAADFVSNRYMREGIEVAAGEALSFVRPSVKCVRDVSGQWRSFGAGQPGRTNRGLLIEAEEIYHPVNSALAGASADGPMPTGWAPPSGADTSVTVVETGTHDGLPLIVFDLLIDNASGPSTVGRGLKFCSLPTVQNDFWTMGLYAQVLETHPGDTCTVPQNIVQVQERNSSGGFLNNSGGIIDNLDLGTLAQRQAITKQMTAPTVAFVEMFYTWNNILAGQRFDRRIGLKMVTATKSQALSSPLVTAVSGTATRAADTATLHLPDGIFDLVAGYEDGTSAIISGVGGDHVLAANPEKAYRTITAMPA